MGRVAISQSKIEASGKIGDRNSKGSINDKGVVELGVDFKVGGLGITTDYGGGIKVNIAGQSITWGRTGGKITLFIGGFEVIVEARNCIITETKKIAGIVVASHTYPDPGCKLPEPPKPLEPPKPSPPLLPDNGVEIPNSLDLMWVITSTIYTYYPRVGPPVVTIFKAIVSEEQTPKNKDILPFTVYKNSNYGSNSRSLVNTRAKYGFHSLRFGDNGTTVSTSAVSLTANESSMAGSPNSWSSTVFDRADYGLLLGYFGTGTSINSFFKQLNRQAALDEAYFTSRDGWAGTTRTEKVVAVIPLIPKKLRPFLPTGNKPPMNNDCCEEILDKLDDFEEIFHVDFFKKNKFPVPAYLLAPGCDAQATTEIKNYYGLFRALFQAIAHGTIISPKVAIEDTDSVKEGDQSLNSEYLSATGWAEAVTKMLYEVVDDGNVATNMDIRTGVTVTQLLVAVADLSHKVDAIIDVIGVTTIRKKDIVETSFSLITTQDNNKGFDPKKDNQKIDLNDDRTTEQVLGDLLRTRKNPIVKEEIHPKSKTLVELLEALINK